MIRVLCTVVVIMASGYRDVRQLDGHLVNEGNDGRNETLLVDFGDQLPTPQVRWVKENDCIYYGDPSKVYGDWLKERDQANKEAEEHRKQFQRDLLREAGNRRPK